MKNIFQFIQTFRKIESNRNFSNRIFNLISLIIFTFILVNFLEEIFYFSSFARRNFVIFFLTLTLSSLLLFFTQWIINFFGIINNNEKIAIRIGNRIPKIKDKLLNILQLNNINPNLDLTKLATKNLSNDLKAFNVKEIVDKTQLKYLYLTIFSLIIFSVNMLNPSMSSSINRILNFNTEFIPPTPFKITNLNSFESALSGDSISLNFGLEGNVIPDSIQLYLNINDEIKKINLNNINNNFNHNINNVKDDFEYWTKFEPYSFFSKWDSIGTEPKKILIKERPKILKSNFIINPPEYTNKLKERYINTGSTQFEIFHGSDVQFSFETNKEIDLAWMLLNNDRYNLNINGKIISGNFVVDDKKNLKIFCLDKNSIPNLNPTQYTFLNIEDTPPTIIVNKPENDFIIDDSYTIYTNLNVNDNFKIEDLWIEYKIFTPGFPDDRIIEKLSLSNNLNGLNEANIIFNWNIDNIGLLMGDELHFWFVAKDNNPSNESITKTEKFIGRFPSLEDLFSEIEDYENESENWIEDIKETISEISEITDEVELELLKKDDIGFENEKKLDEAFNKVENISEEIEQIQKNIDKILEQADKNNLFDENLLEKFNEFQEMLQNIMTPEILDAMEKLKNAMEKMDPESIAKALENFEFNMEEFENELDRFMDMFKMAEAEQALNELSKLMEDLIKQQENLIQEINDNPSKSNLLNSKSKNQEKRFEKLKDKINETIEQINEVSEKTSKELIELSDNSTFKETSDLMKSTSENIKDKKNNQALKDSEDSKNNLNEISEKIDDIKQSFIDESIDILKEEFSIVINNILTISNQQENLIHKSTGIRSNSPEIRNINKTQNDINRELNQLMEDLVELSNKTFFIDTSINRAFGKINSSMKNSISNFEQKKVSIGLKKQKEALNNINLATLLLLEAIKNMNEQNSASGFEQFMEEMQNMSQQQQGLNQSTLKLSQMSMMQQQSLMGELLSQQQQLKEQLDELLDEFPGENNGTMEKIGDDMDEIIQDFKNRKISRETIERQQQILSRMLDNQKSLTQKDFSDKRKSKSGTQKEYDGNLKIDSNLGDKDYLIINAMEEAMKEGHSNEYNKIIRNYFLKLQNEE